MIDRRNELQRIDDALEAAREILAKYTPGAIDSARKSGGDPVTEADLAVDAALKSILPREGEGWLSEETADAPDRLARRRVWIVDPVDGTREFVMGIPEWCVSIALVEDGMAVAGGILNPVTDQKFLGAAGHGVTLNGEPVQPAPRASLNGARIHASRSEVKRGEWERFEELPIEVVPCGSVAFKLALVAGGLTDATWTLVPKNEWDVAGGAALVQAAGGTVRTLEWAPRVFNQRETLMSGFVAAGPGLIDEIGQFLELAPAAE